jgi:hypothetical protein
VNAVEISSGITFGTCGSEVKIVKKGGESKSAERASSLIVRGQALHLMDYLNNILTLRRRKEL